tara:strand:- start:1020 stop:1277 length:258 start_codon:yes stop_codon:yes gene_type:complete
MEYKTWPVGSKMTSTTVDDETGITSDEVWTIEAVDGDAMTMSKIEFCGSYNQAWNGGGYSVKITRKLKIRSDYTSEVIEEQRRQL